MALLETPAVSLGMAAPDFSLLGIDGTRHSVATARRAHGLVVAFICNHCPYVIGSIDRFAEAAKVLERHDIGVIAIMPNDTDAYPADSYDNMVRFATDHGLPFPYVIDKTQAAATAYGAVCTPDYFGFGPDLTLAYRGRLDAGKGRSAPAADAPSELVEAMLAVAAGDPAPTIQHASMGCSIKWRR